MPIYRVSINGDRDHTVKGVAIAHNEVVFLDMTKSEYEAAKAQSDEIALKPYKKLPELDIRGEEIVLGKKIVRPEGL